MMKSTSKLCLLLLIFTFSAIKTLDGQNVQSLRLRRNYTYDNLDKIMDAIGQDLNVRFIFDREYLSRYRTSFNPLLGTITDQNLNTLGGILKILRDAWNMITLIGDDGYIYIARDICGVI